MSTMPTMLSCRKCLRSLISRRIRLASISSLNARGTILMATLLSEVESVAEMTTP